MKKIIVVLGIGLFAIFRGDQLWATPQKGVSFFGQVTASDAFAVQTIGDGFGFDFQVPFGENFSANIFTNSTEEEGTFRSSEIETNYQATGFQIRGWIENFFCGRSCFKLHPVFQKPS